MVLDHVTDDALAVVRVADVALMQGARASVGLDLLAELLSALTI